jgi:hypothetical protein
LPKRNYGFEKRQKELNRQRKQEEKRQRRLDRTDLSVQEPAPEPGLTDLPPKE